MKTWLLVPSLCLLLVTAAHAQTPTANRAATDEYVARIAAVAERTVWLRYVADNLAAAKSVNDVCRRATRSRADESGCAVQYDKDINDVLKQVEARWLRADPEEPKDLLRAKQAARRAWAVYRDAQCHAVAVSYGLGNGASDGLVGCEIEVTLLRIAELSGPRELR